MGNVFITLANGSADLIALNAENAAVPPPINKYGTSAGISFGSFGHLTGISSKK